MRAFLSKLLLIAFIILFATPSSLLAQNWTAPAGPAPGSNTPSPINVSSFAQTKIGSLNVEGGVQSRGTTILNTSLAGDPDFFLSFVPSFFIDTVSVGKSFIGLSTPTLLDVYGSFKYKQPAGSPQPQVNSVLKSIDTNGNIAWGAALPDGVNDGDTLIWNETCNCWETGPVTTGTGLPPGTTGQTIWYSAPNVGQATNQIFHDVNFGNTRTTLNNAVTDIKGTAAVYVGNTSSGVTQIGSPDTKIIGGSNITVGNGQTGQTEINSPDVKLGNDGPNGNYQTVDVKSGTVNFAGVDDGGYQTVNFNSEAVNFSGLNLNPGANRIPYAVNDDGSFRWNENFTYQYFSGGLFPFPLAQFTMRNPEGGLALFQNQGISYLLNDVTIGQDGDLYLDGLGAASVLERTQGLVEHLCYVATTKKVVTCEDSVIGGDNPTPVEVTPVGGHGTLTFTPNDGVDTYTFGYQGRATVKYCGGGGGGGGGGIGAPGENNTQGPGGSGGGGGQSGGCDSFNVDVNPGDVMTFNIGSGGNPGNPASYLVYASDPGGAVRIGATGGSNGQDTTVSINSEGGSVIGGQGGFPGGSVFQPGHVEGDIPFIGLHGNDSLQSNLTPEYWNGQRSSTYFTYNTPESPNCQSCGGKGGNGEAYTATGVLRGPGANAIGLSSPSSGGRGGIHPTDENTNPSHGSYRYGVPGECGAPSFGGGGGGGGHGQGYVLTSPTRTSFLGGEGGCGGDGYVQISGLTDDNNDGGTNPNEYIFSNPGPNQHLTEYQINNALNIPANIATVTVEMWSAGGGAGGINSTGGTSYKRSGGGGSGGYKTFTIARQLLDDAMFTIGAKGQNGSNGGSPTDGTPGGSTSVSGVPQATSVVGGGGGVRFLTTTNMTQGGAGGVPGGANGLTGGYVGGTLVEGNVPCDQSLNNYAVGPQGFGSGARRACLNLTGAVTAQNQAMDGRVRISW